MTARGQTDAAAPLVLATRDQLFDQQRDILRTFAQGRHLEGEDVQAIVEIFAERPLDDDVFQVDVGRGDDAHIGVRVLLLPTRSNVRSWRSAGA